MSCKNDGKAEGHSENEDQDQDQDWAATDNPGRAIPSSRSIMPKGPLFPNLDEAHHAITSRLVSRSAGNHLSDNPQQFASSASFVDVSNHTGSTGSLSSTRHMELASSESNHQVRPRCLTPFSTTASTSAEWANTPPDPSPIVSGFASSSAGNSVGTQLHYGDAQENSANLERSEMEDSVEAIYDTYYMPSASADIRQSRTVSGAPLRNDYPYHSEARIQSVNSYSPDIRRVNTDIRLANRAQVCYEPPQMALPKLPETRGGTKHLTNGSGTWPVNFSRPVRSLCSASNSQDLMNVSTDISQTSGLGSPVATAGNRSNTAQSTTNKFDPDIVIYGRLPTQPDNSTPDDQLCPESDISHGGGFNAEESTSTSTDSDADPFQYDRGSFTVFLQPAREREVSVALRCVSSDSTASASQLFLPPSSTRPATPRIGGSNNPFVNKLQGYQAPSVQYNWDDDGDADPNEFKISIHSSPPSPPPVPPNSPVQPTMNLNEFVQEQNKRRRKDVMSDGADWETVAATSVGQFDSNRAFASSMGFSSGHLIKYAGSSIADYSDTSSCHVPQFDAFGSQERIIPQTGTDNLPTTRLPRTLKEAGHPIFLPKPRIHRVNGYLHNPHRMVTGTTTGSSGNSARSALVEKLSASIRTRTAKKRAHRRNLYLNENQSDSRFQSLDSLSSTYSEQPDGAQMIGTALECETTPTSSNHRAHVNMAVIGRDQRQFDDDKKALLASPIPREPALAHLKGGIPTGPVPLGSPTLFSFPLISLQEAAKRVATRSANEDDLTVTSKNTSMASSKATQRTTPPTPHIAKPSAAHPYRPSSASIFGISMANRGCSGYSTKEPTMLGHGRGNSNATSYKSTAPLVSGRPALSRTVGAPSLEPIGPSSLRNETTCRFPVTTTASGTHYVFDTPPRLVPRDERDAMRRAAALAASHTSTSLRQMAAMDEAHSPFGVLTEDGYLSWEARRRRQAYFYGLCVLCILPFMALLVCKGVLDPALSWYTRGETATLTRRQRRNLKIVGTVISIVWIGVFCVGMTIMVTTMQAQKYRSGY